MQKQPNQSAVVAKMIRSDLKERFQNYKFKVKSYMTSGIKCSHVDIYTDWFGKKDNHPFIDDIMKIFEKYVGKKYGIDSSYPQVTFIAIDGNPVVPEKRKEALKKLFQMTGNNVTLRS